MFATNRFSFRWMILALPALLLLAACVQPTSPPVPDVEISQPIYRWGEVADQVWVLVGYGDALNPTVVEEGAVITANFSSTDGQVTGSGGCNNYFADYTSSDDGDLTIDGPIGATMMACEDGAAQETAYLAALEMVTNWAVTEEGRLELTYDAGQPYEEKLVYIPGETPLTGTTWQLVSWGDPEELTPVEEETTVTATFSPETDTTGTVGGNATCNSYTANYTLDGNQIGFGPVASTRMICPIGADQETAYLLALAAAQTYQIVGPDMQITYSIEGETGVLYFTSLNLPLDHVLWQAVTVAGQPVPEGVEMTALFEPRDPTDEAVEEGIESGFVGGNAGCNSYNTTYETSTDETVNPPVHSLTVNSPMAVTMAMCPDETLAQIERTYLGLLETAETYTIQGGRLTISGAEGSGPEGEIVYAANRQPLLGTYWKLISLGDAGNPQPPVEGSEFTATFNRLPTLPTGTVVGTTGCNTYNATFTANLDEIKVNLPSTTQNEDCPWGKGNFEVEQQYFLGLNSATRYRIIGDILQVIYGEAPSLQVLNYVASTPPVVPPIEPEPVLDLTPLNNTFWYLTAMGRRPTLAGTDVTAQFAVNANGVTATLSGSGGCNNYNTDIGPNFAVGPIVSTKKACQQPVSDQETAYFAWLQTAYTYSLAGNQLLIPTSRGVLTYSTERPTQPVVVPPTAVIRAPEFSDTGQQVIFDGSASTAGAAPIVRYEWNMADGTILVGQTVQYAYDTPGPYEVQLKVIDEAGQVGETRHTIMINPTVEVTGPTAVIQAPDFGNTGQTVTFDGSASTQGTAAIARYEWNMGDGSVQNGQTVKHTYDRPGGYEVQLKVIDQAGQVSEALHNIMINPTVEATPPTAVIQAPDFGDTGQTLTFDGSASTQGTAAIERYEWNMGDGSIQNGQTVQYTYNQPGGYEVQLKVIDLTGLVGEAVRNIMINPTVEVTPPTAVIQGPGTAMVGEPVTFSAANSQQGNGAITGYIWQSGDGQDTAQAPDNTFTVTYAQPGVYNPAVTVIDANNQSNSATTQIEIQAASTDVPLEGTAWALQGTLPETTITIEFGNGTLSGNSGCNTYNAGYSSTRAAGSSNSISVGPITSTQMACPDEVLAQEQTYLANLQSAGAYTISGSTLTVNTAGGPLVYGALMAMPLASP